VRRDQRGKRLAIAAQAASIAGGIERVVGPEIGKASRPDPIFALIPSSCVVSSA